MQLKIQIHAPASSAELEFVGAGLQKYNNASSNIEDVKPLHVIANGEDGAVNGSGIGRTWGACCELQLLWVDTGCRKKGVGTKIMDAFELEASERGCNLVYLDTFTFQAPLFYKKRGYKEVSRVTGFTGGAEKIYMEKSIS